MNNRIGLIILILVSIGLSAALIVTQMQSARTAQEHITTIGEYSSKLVKAQVDLDEQRQVNTLLTNDLDTHKARLVEMTNQLTEVSGTLAKTEATMKEEVAKRDAKINELEAQNQALDQRAIDLSTAI